ncbi:MAG: aminopeptidase P N-terminal domain-containing protein [Bacteroidales bacterium]|nr:aminopeptidase P N-terminal domain-containing protein [Bacteroidales bacterium]
MTPIFQRNFLLTLFFLLSYGISMSQVPANPNNNRLSAGFYKDRRDNLRQIMPQNSVFVLFASPKRTFASDVDYVYHQNPDMFYFSGYPEPNSMMYIFKEEQKVDGVETPFNEVIFTPTAEMSEITFTGKSMGADEAMKELGIQLGVEASKYEEFPVDLLKFKVIITDRLPSDVRESNSPSSLSGLINAFKKKTGIQYIPDNFSLMLSNYISDLKNDTQLKEFIEAVKAYIAMRSDKVTIDPVLTRFINSSDSLTRALIRDSIVNQRINYLYFNRLTSTLRQIKAEEEIAVIKKAIEITCNAHCEVMKAATPEMSEREIQGIHEFMYKLKGAKETGFPLIIASGNNGCTLHYEENDAPRVGNNLILMDVGAMVCGYSADVTRTIPANGRFSPEQLAIYNTVLEAQDSAFSYCNQGMPYTKLDPIGRKVIAEGLKKLGIIEETEQVFVYYTHTISHPIGLDVHDKYLNGTTLTNGMIITLEPGIYIPIGSKCDKKWWGIAVRIEDDILINDNNPVNLSLSAPRKAHDIEKLMKKSSPFNQFR